MLIPSFPACRWEEYGISIGPFNLIPIDAIFNGYSPTAFIDKFFNFS